MLLESQVKSTENLTFEIAKTVLQWIICRVFFHTNFSLEDFLGEIPYLGFSNGPPLYDTMLRTRPALEKFFARITGLRRIFVLPITCYHEVFSSVKRHPGACRCIEGKARIRGCFLAWCLDGWCILHPFSWQDNIIMDLALIQYYR